MKLYLFKVHLQTFLSIPITQKCKILSCDTTVANERYGLLVTTRQRIQSELSCILHAVSMVATWRSDVSATHMSCTQWSLSEVLHTRQFIRLHLKCDGTRAETRFRLSAKRMSPFKSAGTSVQSTTGSRGARISGSNNGYTMFRGSVKSTGYPLHSPVSPSLPFPCVTVCHHISTGVYIIF
jgi:hypothetical protein